MEKMILANRRITVREVAEDLNISIGSCHSIFINDLGMRRVPAKFVPKLLNCDQKQHRMNIANEMLDSVRDDPNFFQRVITGDEAWVYGYDVETKAQSSQWKLPHKPRPKKARQVRSNVKVLLTVFFDCRDVVHHEFLPQGRTVNKEYYLQVIRNLREAIRQKRPDLWKNKNWLLHHDNAPAHTSLLVRDFLAKNNTLMMPQPPYSPDLPPCDFFLFPKLKRPMKGRRYTTLDEIKTASKEELKKILKNDFLKCFEDWKSRWHNLYQIEKLNKQNFETWRLQMQMILVHSDLWIYVNEANIKPEPGNQEFTNWQNKDQKALATIVLSLNPSELVHVKNCKTAEEAWKKIEEVYRPKGPATRVSLTKRLIQMKMRPNDDLKDYLSKFTSLVDNLGEIGAQVPEDFLVILLLCSLPESYEGFRTAIETRDELPKLETLKVKIIEEDQRQREMEGTSSGEQNAFFGNPERKTTNSTKPPTRKDFKFNCHYCGKKGHKAADCWSKRNSKRNNTRMAASLGIRDENILDVNEWCLDSGATAHMCCLRTAFSDLRETEPIPVKLANDQSIEALGTGTVELEVLEHGEPFLLKLENVLFVPGLKGNLISVSTCTEKSFFVKFMRGKAEIVNPLRKICIEAYKRNGLYILRQTKYAKTQFTRMCIDKNSSEIWHNRFGHLNFDDLRKLQRENLVNGLPKGEFKSITSCETCIRGKQTRLPFPEISLTKSTEPLQLIHSDICGPMRTKSYGGALYFATFIDDFSRMIFTFVMKQKSEIFKGFKLFKRFSEKQTGKKIKAIRSDNAAEYLNSDFKEYLSEEGIRHQLSVEYSPQQNGVAERANRTLRVLRYLKGTLCLKITYEKTNETLYGCVDADWGGNLADRKSQTGLVFFLAGGPIAWESKKQQTVALSSTESEYIALCEAGKEAVYLRTLLDEMGFGELLNEPTVLKTDNQGAQQLARNPVHHARTKHIDIKWHYIRSICSDGLIEVVHIPTQENVADILTKGLPRVLSERESTGLTLLVTTYILSRLDPTGSLRQRRFLLRGSPTQAPVALPCSFSLQATQRRPEIHLSSGTPFLWHYLSALLLVGGHERLTRRVAAAAWR
ncbi:hypothetical protein LAZ67_2003604 [Cordylochernes scorpioides]|uniref:Retrovirus-related Pol polyprotein from transposon TNT 1-94 n=1 Tax=Cordylochernes scorpioides TaxID=51811 RepID=A0ABY6K4N6_9ARAC|nr:hypothetical protein LAZ67_2003604 [Cordylochernes scorpioides]